MKTILCLRRFLATLAIVWITAVAGGHAAMLVEDSFEGPAGSTPDAAKFDFSGEVNCNGAGAASLQTWAVGESWITSRTGVAPTHGRALVFEMRAYAYAEHWNPGVYGNQQPRGLRCGRNADDCAEFFTVSRTSIGMRVRNNGAESSSSIAFPAGVDSMHDYGIVITPETAVFTVDGVVAATFATNVPTAPLNVHLATTDGGAGNVPVTIDRLSFSTQSTTPVRFLDESFDGSPASPPDAAKFQWDGQLEQSGSGMINLNTNSADHSWLRSRASFPVSPGRTLRLAMRASAYAEEHWTPGVYGDKQPRGLRVGNDPSNAAEFFSASLGSIGARVCRNGVESSVSVAVPGGVNRMTDLEILLTPEMAVFVVDGAPIARFTENIPDGPLNAHCSTFDGGGVGNVPIGIESMSLSVIQDPPILFSDDAFDGVAGTMPDTAVYEWSGEVARDGSGRLALQTWAAPQSWLRSKTAVIPGAGRTLVMRSRLKAYATSLAVFGDKQPRGLRVGNDPDNAIEFFSSSPTTLGMRCRRNGVETSATMPFPGGMDTMHDYEIRVSPTTALFMVDGAAAATLTTNLPEGALNLHVSTDDGGAGNVPVLIESLSLSVIQPPPSITSISPSSGLPGATVVIEGSDFLEVTAVSFGGLNAASFTVESSTRITAIVPGGVASGPISVTSISGSQSGETDFILMQPQTISFDSLPDKRVDDAPFELSATASSGLAVTYASSDPSIARVSGNTVTITGRGSVTITASQTGNELYLPAAPVACTFYVAGLPPVIGSAQPESDTIATIAEGASLRFSVSATDPEAGDVLTHAWYLSRDGGTTWHSVSASGNDVVLTMPYETVTHPATSLDGGMARVKVVVSDAFRGEASRVWTATTVTDRNRLPGFSRNAGEGSWGWRATSNNDAPPARSNPAEVWTGSKMIFWGGETGSDSPVNTGGRYDPLTDRWAPVTLTGAPGPRMSHTAVWTGSRMIVWGGDLSAWSYSTSRLNTGGIYDPLLDQWTATTTTNAPLARKWHTAVWTGSKMIVWGGTINTGSYYTTATDTGGIYDPETNSWAPVTMTNAPSRRFSAISVWTGSKMIVWGGQRDDGSNYVDTNTGGLYDPLSDTWTAMSTTGAPPASIGTSHVWTGNRLIVWGGGNWTTPTNSGWSYDPASDQWTMISNLNAPSARQSQEMGGDAVWTGNRMLVWGGISSSTDYNGLVSGGLYDPLTDMWSAMGNLNAPSGRFANAMGWGQSCAVVWAGATVSGTRLNSGGVYAAAPEVSVSPANPLPGQELTCSVAEGVADPDAEDQPGLVYEFTWLRGGAVHLIQSLSSPTATLPAETTTGGEVWNCRVRIIDSSGGATPSAEGLAITVDNSAFAAWTADAFTPQELSDPSITGSMASPAGDGITNLMKYALALPPKTCGTAQLPTSSTQDGYLLFAFRRNKQADDLNFVVEASDGLNGEEWSPATTEISREDKGDYWDITVRDSQPIHESTRRFMRLRVQR